MLKEQDKIFLFKWFSSLFTVWYASIGLYLYDPYILQIIYWPLHTHDIEIDVVESTVDWQSYIDKLDADLEIGYMYPPEIDDSESEIIEEVIKEFCYDALETHHCGWEINEGAHGEFIYKDKKIEHTHNRAVEEYVTTNETYEVKNESKSST